MKSMNYCQCRMTQVLFKEQDITAVDREIGGVSMATEVRVQLL